ncbi:hypothetical protein [Methylophilus sp. YYY-1]|uniref:hypothetical protein n=1 Tax=Methylophilus sp. YYY-1 TaxID=2682087 RepID=UPI0023B2578E|nr:hypothetical protein [Methylophilus sp. YYY-1]
MNNPLSFLIAALLVASSVPSLAADHVSPDATPPAQKQKNQVPDTTKNGHYLEPQQDNNNLPPNTKDTASQPQNAQSSKPGNMEKSKRFQQDPKQGGTDVK